MAGFGYARHASLTITTSVSNTITGFEDSFGLSIVAPATLTSTSVTLQVTNSTDSAAVFGTLQSGGSDVVITAGKALVVTPIPFQQLKLLGTSTEAGTRTFTVAKVFLV